MEGERLSDNSGGGGCGGGGGIIDGNDSRPLSQTSSEMDTIGPLQPVKHREKAKLQVISEIPVDLDHSREKNASDDCW